MAWTTFGSSSAQATVLVGSPLTASFTKQFAGTRTVANTALAEPGANLASPVTGTVVAWRAIVTGTGSLELRIIRPAAGGAYTGVGTSDQVIPKATGTQQFTANLPIQTGDLIGLDLVDGINSKVAAAQSVPKSVVAEWGTSSDMLLPDGSTVPPDMEYPDVELPLNADVQPLNRFSLGRTHRNEKKGTATLNLSLPNPGELTGSGKGLRAASGRAVNSRSVGAGPAQLVIRAQGKRKMTLNSTGKVKLNLAVTYTPTGGDPSTQSVKVKLKKKL